MGRTIVGVTPKKMVRNNSWCHAWAEKSGRMGESGLMPLPGLGLMLGLLLGHITDLGYYFGYYSDMLLLHY